MPVVGALGLSVVALVLLTLSVMGARAGLRHTREVVADLRTYRLRPPGPSSLRALEQAFRQTGPKLALTLHEQYGDIIRFPTPLWPIFSVRHPDMLHHVLVANRQTYVKGKVYEPFRLLVGDGLLTAEGSKWRRQRRLLAPHFSQKAVGEYMRGIVEATQHKAKRWMQLGEGHVVDLQEEMTHLAMDIIARTTLGLSVGGEHAELGSALTHLLYAVGERSAKVSLPLWVPTAKNRRFEAELETLDRYIFDLIAARRRHGGDHDNVLSVLVQMVDRGEMSVQQARDELLTIFLAGHETTALSLMWTWCMISEHPDVEARVHAELDAILGDADPDRTNVMGLTYTNRVIMESMRLFPPIWMYGRDVAHDDYIGPYFIPAGAMVLVSPLATHRDPRFWPEPDRFDPERFLPERIKARHPAAYFPYGLGSRTCMGNHFATMELLAVLSTLARRFRIRVPYDQSYELELTTTLRPKHDVVARLEMRDRAAARAQVSVPNLVDLEARAGKPPRTRTHTAESAV